MSESYPTPAPTYCYNHPNRETSLRCNRCDRPICSDCAVLTPTGYRCKECVRSQQKIFDTANSMDYVLALVIAAVLSYIGSVVAGVMGFFTLFLAPVIGIVISEVIRWVIHRRRSRLLFQLTAGAAVVGALPRLLMPLLGFFTYLASGNPSASIGFSLIGLLWPAAYVFLVASTVYYRLSGIQVR